MTDLNTVTLIGRLTRDLGSDERSFSYTNTGKAKGIISIACNRSVKRGDSYEDEVSYFDVIIWGKTAENLKQYLKKGTQVAVDGYLKQDRWEQDGQKRSRITIVANNIHLLGSKNDNNGGGNANTYNNNSNNNASYNNNRNNSSNNNGTLEALKQSGMVDPNAIPDEEEIPF